MSAVEFSPQSAGVINVEQSEAARAKDTDIGATTISAKAATLHNRMVDFLVLIRVYLQVGGDRSRKSSEAFHTPEKCASARTTALPENTADQIAARDRRDAVHHRPLIDDSGPQRDVIRN